MIERIKHEMDRYQFEGNRSLTTKIMRIIREEGLEIEASEAILKGAASAIKDMKPLTAAAKNVATRLITLANIDTDKHGDEAVLKVGERGLDWAARAGLVKLDKHIIINEKNETLKNQWFLVSDSQDLTQYIEDMSPAALKPSPLNGFIEWQKPVMTIGDFRVELVKKSIRFNMLEHYQMDEMPSVYGALNKLGRETFQINPFIAEIAKDTGLKTFVPRRISNDERKAAMRALNDLKRSAMFVEELKFQEMHKWLGDVASDMDDKVVRKIASKKAREKTEDWQDTKAEEHTKVISAWSCRQDYENVMKLADEWAGHDINYLFTMCTRGRIYTIQDYLTPLGSDIAKALLLFKKAQPLSLFWLYVHVSNCFGNDSGTLDERFQWTKANMDKLLDLGRDPWANWHIVEEFGLHEEKTCWQALAACNELVKMREHITETGSADGYMSHLIIGLDSTASGTQILSMWARDHEVAPHVNISPTKDGRKGDFYTYLAGFLKPKMMSHRHSSDTLDAALLNWDRMARGFAKRNSMTFVYSGTKYGFGIQHWQDRKTYKPKAIAEALTRADCRIIGNEMYDTCTENIKGGAQVMSWLQDGINYHEGGAMVSWKMPDGFTAFQVCDASKAKGLKMTIGSQIAQVRIYIFQDKPDKRKHKSGIAPNFVHAADSFLLRTIVNNLPEDRPISTVHDQFSTSGDGVTDLQNTARSAYKMLADRDMIEDIASDAFGIHRELPLVGHWDPSDLDKTELFIC